MKCVSIARIRINMGRKRAPKPDDPEQSKRFLDIAKETGAGEDSEALERTSPIRTCSARM
jgi:hypothetical protein